MVVLPFVSHADGRPYRMAYKLRTRYSFSGQIRAVGDVKFDQLDFLTRVGCDAFELPESEDLQAALRAFSEFSEVYQPAADQRRLIFRAGVPCINGLILTRSTAILVSMTHIIFVKKILADGSLCKKCREVSERLESEVD